MEKDRQRARIVDRQVDVDAEMAPCVEPAGIDNTEMQAVVNEAPRRRPSSRLRDGEAPQRIACVAPGNDQKRNRRIAGSQGRRDG